MNPLDVLSALDARIQSRSILCHPFYVAWQRGSLTREQLATYARVYYPHVAAFPGYLESAIAGAADPAIRAELQHNLDDERTQPKAHNELWLDFAEDLGLDRQVVAQDAPHPAAASIVSVFSRLSSQDVASGLAALYAYESQQPDVSAQKREGLQQHYAVHSDKGLAYFDVHATTDLQHRQGERDALVRCLEAGVPSETILRAADEALDAYWHLLDGVCTAAGITN